MSQHIQAHPDLPCPPEIPIYFEEETVVQMYNSFHKRLVPQPEYSCPTCRAVIKEPPVQVLLLRDIADMLISMKYQVEVISTRTRLPWVAYFPTVTEM